MMFNYLVLLLLALLADSSYGYHVFHDDGSCSCEQVEVVSSNAEVAKKHGQLLGTYRRRQDKVNSRFSYEHFSGNFFLFYNVHSQGFWAVGERLNTDVVRLENQGDALCPYRMKSTWRFADGNLAALVYDLSLKVVCLDDPCSMAHCGHQARCVQEEVPVVNGEGDGTLSNVTKCDCNPGFYGDPYDRCYPAASEEVECQCRRLIFSSRSSVATAKHRNSYGEYFLFGEYDLSPVYQHFAGVEYLYKRDGNWLISDEVGLREAGLQNQGDVAQCPYRFRTTWEYADIEQPGWQWVYDYTARLVCPTDPCSLTKCGFHATCRQAGDGQSDQGGGTCQCDEGYEGNAYIRCFPVEHSDPEGCPCRELTLSSLGASALAQADKMGEYYHFATYNGRPAYQHRSGLDFLYYAEGNAWVIGARFGGSRVGVVNFDRGRCPYKLEDSWKHSVGGKLEVDASLSVVCSEGLGYGGQQQQHHQGGPGQIGGPSPTILQGQQVLPSRTQSPVPVYVSSTTATPSFQNASISTTQPVTPAEEVKTSAGTPPPPSQPQTPATADPTTNPPPPPPPPTSTTTNSPVGNRRADDGEDDFSASLPEASTAPPYSASIVTPKFTATTQNSKKPIAPTSTPSKSPSSPRPNDVKKIEEKEKAPVTVLPVSVVVAEKATEKAKDEVTINRTVTATTTTTTTTTTSTTTEEPKINLPCPCEEIFVNSTHPPTIEKHGAQLGRYLLYDLRAERPVYKHADREQYLYYHPYSGGNWLINYEVGLLYGGIQNSKDLPVCPYLVNTVWQYGDSELGGWVYDQSLTVTCPTDQCSVLKCGFRAQCVHDDQGKARCLCRKGFEGDPSTRCLPKVIDSRCPCKKLKFSSSGLARDHQRDKMGEYFLWGYYNARPVYQHFSGLDFLYFHKNNVWGVGPKIGGNSAGLLNFGSLHCPYALRTPWEFGTKDKVMRRQIDSSLKVECLDQQQQQAPKQPQQPLQQRSQLPPPPSPQRRPPPYQVPHQVVSYSSRRSSASSSISAGGNKLPHGHHRHMQQQQQQVHRGSIAQCGVRTILPDPERLMDPPGGDRSAAYGSFPWQARVALSERDPTTGEANLRHLCSGAIVSDRFILTAASCLTAHPMFKYRVVSGDDSLSEEGAADSREAVHALQSLYLHDLYDESSGRHDLALAKVRASAGGTGGFFKIGQFVMPACLPPPGSRYTKDVLCEASSWGREGSGSLRAAAVPVVRNTVGSGETRHCGPRGSLCVGPAAGDRDGSDFNCDSDAGTPLVCQTRRGGTLIGILGGRPDCQDKKNKGGKESPAPAVLEYVRVSDYVEWIEERLKL